MRIWSIYDQEYRLILALSDEPGEFNFARIPSEQCAPVRCDFATLQCYDLKSEPDILTLLHRAMDLEDFLERLKRRGYKVLEGRPQPYKFARL